MSMSSDQMAQLRNYFYQMQEHLQKAVHRNICRTHLFEQAVNKLKKTLGKKAISECNLQIAETLLNEAINAYLTFILTERVDLKYHFGDQANIPFILKKELVSFLQNNEKLITDSTGLTYKYQNVSVKYAENENTLVLVTSVKKHDYTLKEVYSGMEAVSLRNEMRDSLRKDVTDLKKQELKQAKALIEKCQLTQDDVKLLSEYQYQLFR